MARTIAVYGASGCGRGVMPVLRAQAEADDALLFVDDAMKGRMVNGHDVIDFEAFRALDGEKAVALAVADPRVRATLAARCTAARIEFLSIRACDTVIMDDVEIGEGALLSPYVVLTSNIRIGRHFHANLHSIVEHDCKIGDFVTFAPAVRCNGNVTIGDHTYIGAGAIIRQGRPGRSLTIGEGVTVGAGAVVLRDVTPGETVIGNPARTLPR